MRFPFRPDRSTLPGSWPSTAGGSPEIQQEGWISCEASKDFGEVPNAIQADSGRYYLIHPIAIPPGSSFPQPR
jgi:hypothetical protein